MSMYLDDAAQVPNPVTPPLTRAAFNFATNYKRSYGLLPTNVVFTSKIMGNINLTKVND